MGAVLLLAWLLGRPAAAQQPAGRGEATLVPPPTAVALTEPFTLGFRLQGAALAGQPEFPELEGFRKGGVVKATTTRLLPGGGRTTELTVTQRYLPYAEGDYPVPAFDLTVNGQVLHSPGGRVRVGAAPTGPAASSGSSAFGQGSLDQLLGRPKQQNFYEPADYATLALEADQERIYVGQGVRVGLYFYVRPADQALLSFYDFNAQLTALRQQLRQPTAWEVAPAEPSVRPDSVRRQGQVYLRFRLAEGTYYPLTARALRFPSLALTMTKFKLLKNPQPGDTERLARYKTYTAPALVVAVRALPARRGAADSGGVAVGDYTLHEGISSIYFRTGEAFTYTFGIEGRGNVAALRVPRPAPPARLGLAIYGPDITEETLPDGRQRKTFRYRIVAHRPGAMPLDSLFQLPFFNPTTARYDTLRAGLRPEVSGAAQALGRAINPDDDPFYGPALARADARLQPLDVYQQVSRYAAWLVAALLLVSGVGWWRARGNVK